MQMTEIETLEFGIDLSMDEPWYAIYTRHQHEKAVASGLAAKGFGVFLPQYVALRRWKDRAKRLSLPLFPCYLFICGDIGRRLDIVTTPGFNSFVGINNRPIPVPREDLKAVRRLIQCGSGIEPYPFLRFGDRVRIREGPLQGIEGILVRKKNSLRLVLSVELLQKSVSVEVDAHLVERASSWVARIRPVCLSTGVGATGGPIGI